MLRLEVRLTPTRKLFYNEDNYFGIYGAEVHPDDLSGIQLNQYSNISIKGTMPELELTGREYTAIIKEDPGSTYKGSYIVESIIQKRPVTQKEQKNFLKSILTENQIINIYSIYKDEDDIVGMIEKGEFDYTKVKGLGNKTYEKLQQKVLDNVDMGEVLAFCNRFDIKYNMVAKLVKEYKNPTIVIDVITKNPYLLTEIKGIGFKKADEIAKAMKYEMTSEHRIDSCLLYCIHEEHSSGHSWIGRRELINKAMDLLNIRTSYIEDRIKVIPEGVVEVDGRYTTKAVYEAEKYIAMRATQFKTHSKKIFKSEEIEEFLDEYCKRNDVELEENQRQFFHDWNENSILLLIGGGGMGRRSA